MSSHLSRVAAAALLALASASALLSAAPAAASPDDAAIRALNADFAATWNRHDAKAAAAFWAPDGDLVTPDGRWWKNRAEIEKFFTDSYAAGGMFHATKFSSTAVTVRFLTPDIAVADYTYQIAGVKDPSGKEMTDKGNYTTIHVRKDGKWWIVVSRPMNPAMPPPAPMASAPTR